MYSGAKGTERKYRFQGSKVPRSRFDGSRFDGSGFDGSGFDGSMFEPGTNQEPGTRNPEPGTRNLEPGTFEPGTRNYGTWNLLNLSLNAIFWNLPADVRGMASMNSKASGSQNFGKFGARNDRRSSGDAD